MVPNDIVNIISAMAKARKAFTFYPSDHPVLKQTVLSLAEDLKAWLKDHSSLALVVKGQKIFYQNEPVTKDSPELRDFIFTLTQYQIRELLISAQLVTREIVFLLRTLALESDVVMKKGGLKKVLAEVGVQAIKVREVDYDELLERDAFDMKSEKEFHAGVAFIPTAPEEKPAPPADNSEHFSEIRENIDLPPVFTQDSSFVPMEETKVAHTEMEEILHRDMQRGMNARQVQLIGLLQKFETENEDRNYFDFIQQLIGLCDSLMAEDIFEEPLLTLLIFHRHSFNQSERTPKQRKDALYGFQSIAHPPLIKFFFDYLQKHDRIEKEKALLVDVLLKFGPTLVNFLINQMGARKDLLSRRIIMTVLTSFGPQALDSLHQAVSDRRWHVVRDIVAVLGEIAHPKSVIYLEEALGHPNAHVRREAIRALSKIHTVEAFELLLLGLKSDDSDRRLQTVISLGESKNPAAVAPLTKLIKKMGLSQQTMELKRAAVQALGELRQPESLSLLKKILFAEGWNPLSGGGDLTMRISAAEAIGKIGGPEAIKLLTNAAVSEEPELSQRCIEILGTLEGENQANPPPPP